MSKKIIGVTVGTTIDPKKFGGGTELAEQVAKNTEDIAELSEQIANLMGEVNEVAELLGGNA